MTHSINSINSPIAQRGSVLLAAMMILIVLTLLTFSASNSGLLQSKMSSTVKDSIWTLEAAEAAVVDAESLAASLTYTLNGGEKGYYEGDCDEDSSFCFQVDKANYNHFDEEYWEKSTKLTVSCGVGCEREVEYIILKLGIVDLTLGGSGSIQTITNQYQDQGEGVIGDVYKFKIVARAKGYNEASEKVLVTYFASALSS